MAKLGQSNGYVSKRRSLIGKNSEAIASGDLVSVSTTGVKKATTSEQIAGISSHSITLASDNFTVGKAKVTFTVLDKNNTIVLPISATATEADEYSYFLITSAQVVDYATKTLVPKVVNTSDAGAATDPVLLAGQLKLVKLLSSLVGEFEVVYL